MGGRRDAGSPGALRLRGREEDPSSSYGAHSALLPGDWGLLQYGSFSVFFQFGLAPPPLAKKRRPIFLVGLSSGQLGHSAFRLLRARPRAHDAPPIPKPAELSNPDEIAARFGIAARVSRRAPSAASRARRSSGGTGIKDPGAHDTKKQGGGKKMADAEGKLGKKAKKITPSSRARVKNGLGGVSDVLASETGDEIKHTLRHHQLGRCGARWAQFSKHLARHGDRNRFEGDGARRWRHRSRSSVRIRTPSTPVGGLAMAAASGAEQAVPEVLVSGGNGLGGTGMKPAR